MACRLLLARTPDISSLWLLSQNKFYKMGVQNLYRACTSTCDTCQCIGVILIRCRVNRLVPRIFPLPDCLHWNNRGESRNRPSLSATILIYLPWVWSVHMVGTLPSIPWHTDLASFLLPTVYYSVSWRTDLASFPPSQLPPSPQTYPVLQGARSLQCGASHGHALLHHEPSLQIRGKV